MSANDPTPREVRRIVDEAMARGRKTLDPVWAQRAAAIMRKLLKKHGEFSANDVWAAGLEKPTNGRHMGEVVRILRAGGIIKSSGRKVPSRGGHGQGITVWVAA